MKFEKPIRTPPPKDLSRLNPIQRFMQRGEMERSDWIWLVLIVLAYATARPYIQKAFRWYFTPKEVKEGEEAQKQYYERRAKVSPNEIRSAKVEPEILKSTLEEDEAVTTGSKPIKSGKAVNRKVQFQMAPDVAVEKSNVEALTGPLLEESDAERLLEWDDISAKPAQKPDGSDIKAWLDRWEE